MKTRAPKPATSTARVRLLESRLRAEGGTILRLRVSSPLLALLDSYAGRHGESRTGAALRALATGVKRGGV
jgi:hypothetical protein